jgi:hypothetical protein
MARHAIVDQNGIVVNVIIWEGSSWLPPKNHYVIQDDAVDIGDKYDFNKKTFTKKSS